MNINQGRGRDYSDTSPEEAYPAQDNLVTSFSVPPIDNEVTGENNC